jgi:hypothetical protein
MRTKQELQSAVLKDFLISACILRMPQKAAPDGLF